MLLCVVNGPAPVCGSCLLSAHSRGRLKTLAVQDSTGSLHSNHLAHHAHTTSQKIMLEGLCNELSLIQFI